MLRVLFKDSAFYGVLNVLSKSITFLSFFLYVNYFEKVQIGKVELFISFQAVAMILMSCQLESGYVRFYFQEKEKAKLNSLLVSVFIYLLICSVLVIVFLSFVVEPLLFDGVEVENREWIKKLILAYAFILNFYNLINLKFRYDENKKAYFAFSFTVPCLTLILIYLYVVAGEGGIDDLFLAFCVGLGVPFVGQIVYLLKNSIRENVELFDWRPLFKYSLPFLPVVLVVTSNEKLLVFLFNRFWQPEEIANYAVALRLAAILGVALGAFKMAFDTHINKYICDSNRDNKTISKLLKNYLILAFSAYLIFLLGSPLVNYLFLDSKYTESIQASYLLGVSLIMLNLVMFTSPGFCIENRTIYKLYISIAQFVAMFVGVFFLLTYMIEVKFVFLYMSAISFFGLVLNTYLSNKLYSIGVSYLMLISIYLGLLSISFLAVWVIF